MKNTKNYVLISRALHRQKVQCLKAISFPLLNSTYTDRLTAWKERCLPQKASFLITQSETLGLATLTSLNLLFRKLSKDVNSTLHTEAWKFYVHNKSTAAEKFNFLHKIKKKTIFSFLYNTDLLPV